MRVIVGISEMAVSGNPDDTLITYSLGSCVGVAVYDPVIKVGALAHCMLPMSMMDKEKAKEKPFMFTDTGVVELLNAVLSRGATKKNLQIKVAGGSNVLDDKGFFKIGERNYTVVRKVLWKNSILIAGEDVGGSVSRTMSLHIGTGRTVIKIGGHESEL